MKIPKFVEAFIRKEIALSFDSYHQPSKHLDFKKNIQDDIWNETKLNKFALKDFDKKDYWVVKPAFQVLKWLRKQKEAHEK